QKSKSLFAQYSHPRLNWLNFSWFIPASTLLERFDPLNVGSSVGCPQLQLSLAVVNVFMCQLILLGERNDQCRKGFVLALANWSCLSQCVLAEPDVIIQRRGFEEPRAQFGYGSAEGWRKNAA